MLGLLLVIRVVRLYTIVLMFCTLAAAVGLHFIHTALIEYTTVLVLLNTFEEFIDILQGASCP